MSSYSVIEIGDKIILNPIPMKGGMVKMQTTLIKQNKDVYQECRVCERLIKDEQKRLKCFTLICSECKNK